MIHGPRLPAHARRALLCLALSLLLPSPRSSACLPYEDYVRWNGAAYWNGTMDLAPSGDHVFGCGLGHFWVFAAVPEGGLVETAHLADDRLGGQCVALSEDLAVAVGDEGGGIVILDVSNEKDPQVVTVLETPGGARSICVAGNFLAVADGTAGLQIVDVRSPGNPLVIGSLQLPGDARSVAWSGSLLCVATDLAFHVVYVDPDGDPDLLGTIDFGSWSVRASGGLAAASDGYATQIIDITDPASPRLRGRVECVLSTLQGVQLLGTVDQSQFQSELLFVDVSDPDRPATECSVRLPGYIWSVRRDDHTIALNLKTPLSPHHYLWSVQRLEVGNGLLAPERANIQTWCEVRDVDRVGGHLLVSDLACPMLVAASPMDNVAEEPVPLDDYRYVYQAEVRESLAYMVRGAFGLDIVDMTNPLAPTLVGSVATAGNAHALVLDGSLAYVGDETGHINVVDVSDPGTPVLVGDVDVGQEITKLEKGGSTLFAVSASHDLFAIDVSEPAAPAIMLHYDQHAVHDVAVQDQTLFVASTESCWYGVVRAFSWSDPGELIQLWATPCPGYAEGILYHEGYVYAACGRSGVAILDASDPQVPARVIGWELTSALDVVPADSGVWLLCEDGARWIPEPCGRGAENVTGAPMGLPFPNGIRVTPNPWRESLEISFSLPAETWARVDLYDALGRRVRSLLPGGLQTGDCRLSWNGRDDAGDPVPSGVYSVRLGTRGASRSVRIVRIE